MRTIGFQPETIYKWNKILNEFNDKGVQIVEFKPKAINNLHWGLLIETDLSAGESKEQSTKAKSRNLNNRVNRQLKKAMMSTSDIVHDHWEKLFTALKLSGFYIPLQDIYRVEARVLKSHLNFYRLLIKHFDYQEYFSILQENLIEVVDEEDKIPHAIWWYLVYYVKFLRKLKLEAYSQYEVLGSWFSEQLDQDDFHQRLPSEQVTILMFNQCESMVSETVDQWHKQRIYFKATTKVEAFFSKYKNDFDQVFGEEEVASTEEDLRQENESESNKTKEESGGFSDNIKDDFVSLFKLDNERFFVQELLDNQSNINLASVLPLLSQVKYGPASLFNFSGVIKDKVFNKKERPAGDFREHDEDLPVYFRPKEITYPNNVQYWFDLDSADRKEVFEIVNQNASVELLGEAERVAKQRSQDYLINLINLITAPILYWNRIDSKIFPQWNLFSDDEAENFREIYRQKKVSKVVEKIMLEEHLKALFLLNTVEEINAYIAQHNPLFSYQKFHKTWELELNKLITRITQKKKYYDSRMREFGIYDAKINKKNKVTYLEEMLAIEEEVKPYINFVKQAFQTALPIRKKVSFSDYRHSNDGVEFDADTLFDQEKWIRADVMRVMESHIERGEAIQINTFCLDFSGSMVHDRMRNLFKILYLLVIGLEDRKSFDSFHFFSNTFIEVADFDESYTDRKVLFKIMTKISQIDSLGVHFGGLGGTNISDGVAKSHEKMKDFISEFQKSNPEANIVTSMFVITDGEPSLGITNLVELNEFIESKRQDGDVEIKGIFIKSEDDFDFELMDDVFGEGNFVETNNFEEGVNKFVKIMTETYKAQRKAFKWKQKRQKLGLSKK